MAERLDEQAFLRGTGNDGGTVVSSLEQGGARFQAEVTTDLFPSMTLQAGVNEDGTDLRLEKALRIGRVDLPLRFHGRDGSNRQTDQQAAPKGKS
jgi:hypothetical protein